MKKRHKALAETSFWPGYVDALTNVVLNLLFLISILAAGVFSMGMESARKVVSPFLRASGPEVVQAAQPVAKPDALVTQIKVIEASESAPLAQAQVELKGPRAIEDRQELMLKFGPDAIRMAEREKQQLLPKLRTQLGQNPSDIVVWAAADVRNPVARRATYLRIMATRDLLVASGQPSDRIETRLLAGSTTQNSSQTVYIIFQQDLPNEK